MSISDAATYARSMILADLPTDLLFRQLREKFAVYVVRKPDTGYGKDGEIHDRWVDLVGSDHVVVLSDEKRVVDTLFGVMAVEQDCEDIFEAEMRGRQTSEQCAFVFAALRSIRKERSSSDGTLTRLHAGGEQEGTDVGSLLEK